MANLALVAVIIAGLLGGMALLRGVAIRHGWAPEVQRKLVHVAAGGTAIMLPLIFAADWPIYLLLGLTAIAMLGLRLTVLSPLGDTLHKVERRSYGEFLLVAAVTLVFLFSGRDAVLYVLPLAILTLADAAAALAGSAYGRTRFAVADGGKSVEGSVVFFVVAFIVALLCLLLLSSFPPSEIALIALMVSAFATLIEADSWRGFDNLFLPLGILILLRSAAEVQIIGLALRLGVLALVIGAAIWISRRSFERTHLVRVHILALFLILSVTALQNAVLPALMLAAQWLSLRHDPAETAPEAALNTVGALAIFSFGFEALGAATGHNALAFYGLATGAAALCHVTLALRDRPVLPGLLLVMLSWAGIVALGIGVMAVNPEETRWFGAGAWPFAALLAMQAGAVLLRPAWYAANAPVRVAALAGGAALALYIALMMKGAA